MRPQNINTDTYAIDATTASATRALAANYIAAPSYIIYNSGTAPVFVRSYKASDGAPTMVFPTAANTAAAGLMGSVIPPGAWGTFDKTDRDDSLATISTGTATIYVSVGWGV